MPTKKAQAKKRKSANKAQAAKEKSSSSAKSARKRSTLPIMCLKENEIKSQGKKERGKNRPKEDKAQLFREVEKNVSASKIGPGIGTKVKKKHMGNALEEKSGLIESVTAQELQIAGIFSR